MAYETSNPIKKVAQMGDANSLWFYSDDEATSAIVASGYFSAESSQLKKGDLILLAATNQTEADILVVSSATAATPVTTVKLA